MGFKSRWKTLARDTALLTGSSLIMRCIAMAYQVWLVGRIGAPGIGLYQLVASVNVLCATFAISGIRFTTTRLVSEEIGTEHWDCVSKAVGHCAAYALFFGCTAAIILYAAARPIGFLWIGDARTVLSLRIVAFRMPFIALSSVLNGYCIASGQAGKSAAVQFLEQLFNILLVMLFLSRLPGNDLETICAAVSLGGTLADILSLLMVGALYLLDRRGALCARGITNKLTARMFRIAVPLALSAYARTSLTTLENLLVPRKLKASGLSANSALAGYGTITGMVFPIIGFPSCLLSALAELIIPELTEAQMRKDTAYIMQTVSTLLRTALLFSLATAVFLFFTAEPLGYFIYHTAEIGKYIRLFAFLVPIMYMDIVTDGCLKGLGQMIHSMRYNVTEALLGVLLVIKLLPRYAFNGYLFVIFFCEIYNFTLSIRRLRKVIDFSLLPKAGNHPLPGINTHSVSGSPALKQSEKSQ